MRNKVFLTTGVMVGLFALTMAVLIWQSLGPQLQALAHP